MDKRIAGQVTKRDGEDIWLVLSESTGKEGVGFTHRCGANIKGVLVYHSVWDGLFPCSGGGEVRTETVPYCPKCETPPSQTGIPISELP